MGVITILSTKESICMKEVFSSPQNKIEELKIGNWKYLAEKVIKRIYGITKGPIVT